MLILMPREQRRPLVDDGRRRSTATPGGLAIFIRACCRFSFARLAKISDARRIPTPGRRHGVDI